MLAEKIGFLGAGQMARALARGLVEAGEAPAAQLWASDPVPAARESFATEIPGAQVSSDNAEVVANCDIVFLAVKPQHARAVLEAVGPQLDGRHLLISIVAGMTLAKIAVAVPEGVRLVRVMPNTPCLVRQSASGYSLGPGATADDAEHVAKLLSAVGQAHRLDESLLDAVTGLAGSGPAFVYVLIEALSDGGVRMGLPRAVATAMAAQTVRGAAEMVRTTGEHPAVLKDRVASPAGTTIAGLEALEAGGARAALMSAVAAAARRSTELAQV